jgi:hypothetical protein
VIRWRAGVAVMAFAGIAFSAEPEDPAEPIDSGASGVIPPRPGSGAERRVSNASDGASAHELLAIQGGCAVVCEQHQACIEQRCIEKCSPSCQLGSYCAPSGECTALPQPEKPVLTEADRQRLSGHQSKDKTAVVFVDVGGIVGYGARLGMEWGKRDSLVSRVHLLNTGIMSYAAFTENEFQRFEWGFGTSVGYRHYEASTGNMRGFYFGGGLDFSVIRVGTRGKKDADGKNYAVQQMIYSAAPYGEFGYRWVFGDIAIAFGPQLALRYPVATGLSGDNTDICEETGRCEEIVGRRLEGTVNFEIGWFQ